MGENQYPVRLAVAMIARDEAATIGAALESVRKVADEIIVVDTGSQDDTRAVASAARAKVLSFPWEDSFSAARNFVARHLTGDWALWLDASETLRASDAAGLKQFVRDSADPRHAYGLLIRVPAPAAQIASEQIVQTRLVPVRADLQFSGRVLESLDASLTQLNMSVDVAPFCLNRDPRNHDPRRKADKASRNLRLLDLEIKERGQLPSLLIGLGEALSNLGDESGSVAAFRAALEKCPPDCRLARAAFYGLLAAQGEDPTARTRLLGICSEALSRFPLDGQILCALGGYLQSDDRLELAARAYQAASEHGETDLWLWHVPDIREIGGVCLALVRQLQDDDVQAGRVLEDLLVRYPNSVRVRRCLVDLYIKHDRRKDALSEVEKLPSDTPQRDALKSAVRGACLASRQNWIPAIAYLQTAYQAGCRDPLCLRWLAVGLMATDDLTAAAPIVHEWRQIEPRNLESLRYLDLLTSGGQVHTAEDESSTGRKFRVDAANASVPAPPANLASRAPDSSRPVR